MSLLDFLETVQRAAAHGYLFHGSPLRLGVVEPHQAHDLSHSEDCHYAVYASDDPLIGLICSVLHRKAGRWYISWSVENGQYSLEYFNCTLDDGFLYLLRPETFTPLPNKRSEYMSLTPCQPDGVIITTPQLLQLIGIQVTVLSQLPDFVPHHK